MIDGSVAAAVPAAMAGDSTVTASRKAAVVRYRHEPPTACLENRNPSAALGGLQDLDPVPVATRPTGMRSRKARGSARPGG